MKSRNPIGATRSWLRKQKYKRSRLVDASIRPFLALMLCFPSRYTPMNTRALIKNKVGEMEPIASSTSRHSPCQKMDKLGRLQSCQFDGECVFFLGFCFQNRTFRFPPQIQTFPTTCGALQRRPSDILASATKAARLLTTAIAYFEIASYSCQKQSSSTRQQ